ncbi:MAG: DUF6092 family protein [Candidatus Bathyarchaeia archaeon]
MKNEKKVTGDDYLLELVAFLATSARGCVGEPPSYGPFRLIDALSRLIDLPKYATCLKDDEFLRKIKAEIDEKKFLVMTNDEAFRNMLDSVVLQVSRQLRARASA